jgi:hypothetical protein
MAGGAVPFVDLKFAGTALGFASFLHAFASRACEARRRLHASGARVEQKTHPST